MGHEKGQAGRVITHLLTLFELSHCDQLINGIIDSWSELVIDRLLINWQIAFMNNLFINRLVVNESMN